MNDENVDESDIERTSSSPSESDSCSRDEKTIAANVADVDQNNEDESAVDQVSASTSDDDALAKPNQKTRSVAARLKHLITRPLKGALDFRCCSLLFFVLWLIAAARQCSLFRYCSLLPADSSANASDRL